MTKFSSSSSFGFKRYHSCRWLCQCCRSAIAPPLCHSKLLSSPWCGCPPLMYPPHPTAVKNARLIPTLLLLRVTLQWSPFPPVLLLLNKPLHLILNWNHHVFHAVVSVFYNCMDRIAVPIFTNIHKFKWYSDETSWLVYILMKTA